jgi:hypothetical protein
MNTSTAKKTTPYRKKQPCMRTDHSCENMKNQTWKTKATSSKDFSNAVDA